MPFDCMTNITDVNSSVVCANTISEGYLGIGILMVIFCIMFITLKSKGYATENSMSAALFITTAASGMIFLFGIIPNYIPPILALATGFSVVVFVLYGWGE